MVTTKFDRQTHLSGEQLYELALSTGLDKQGALIAAGIAVLESGGDVRDTNHNTDGSTDYGLWQINSVHKVSPAAMFIPSKNAQAMYAISGHGKNWKPWVVYNKDNGVSVLKESTKIARGKDPIAGAISGAADAVIGGAGSAVNSVVNAFGLGDLKDLFDALFSVVKALLDRGFYIRAGKVLLGFTILIMGLSKLGKMTGGGRVAKDARKAGGVVKSAKDAALGAAGSAGKGGPAAAAAGNSSKVATAARVAAVVPK